MPPRTVSGVKFRISTKALAGPWAAGLIPLSGFPAAEAEIAPVRDFLGRVVAHLVERHRAALETFVQLTTLHLDDGARRVSANGREWMPSMGLGAWPNREPPHGWTQEELQALVPGEKLRPMMDIVLRIGVLQKGDAARDAMLGVGSILQFVVPPVPDQFLSATRALLLPPITDPCFTSFPFYVPLFELKAVEAASEPELNGWLCGAHACIRESPEDSGVLLIAEDTLPDVLRSAGAVPLDDDPDTWAVPG